MVPRQAAQISHGGDSGGDSSKQGEFHSKAAIEDNLICGPRKYGRFEFKLVQRTCNFIDPPHEIANSAAHHGLVHRG